VAVLMAGIIRLLLLWASTKLSFAMGSDISISIYKRSLYQPYAIHIARNNSVIIDGIITKSKVIISNIITPFISLVSASIILTVVIGGILMIEPLLALSCIGVFFTIYAVIMFFVKRGLINNSKIISEESVNVIKALQEGLGGIREVLFSGTQGVYCKKFASAEGKLRRAEAYTQFVAQCPRYLVESIGMLLIVTMAFQFEMQRDGVAKALPVLGVMALAAQRMLPILQQGYLAWSSIQGAKQSLQDTLDLLDQQLPKFIEQHVSQIQFQNNFELIDVGYRYSAEAPFVLNNIRIKIERGSRIGFIGPTGSGKSTLLDIIMGLLEPTVGRFEVDGCVVNSDNLESWRSHIAHVPQTIFLTDNSIAENIAFGIPKDEINYERVKYAATLAQLNILIENWPLNYQTRVGERGISLSGGQLQRIGIARAFYNQKNIIIFDEATNSLDDKTESSIMRALNNVDTKITLLIIAHRITTLYGCSKIVELEEGRIKRICNYEDLDAM
jgi:ATP-binding cassette, subfamily B, bacterial PglK